MKPALIPGALALFLAACSPTGQPVSSGKADFSFEAGSFDSLLNTARRARGLGSLAVSARLNAAARGHAADMASGGFLSHTGSDGRSVGQRVRSVGYGFCWVAENISVGRSSEAEVFARWMDSAGHRKNMLSRQPTEYGLAVAAGNYRVLVLGRPGC